MTRPQAHHEPPKSPPQAIFSAWCALLDGPEERFVARFGLDFHAVAYTVVLGWLAVLLAAIWYFVWHRFTVFGLAGFTIFGIVVALALSAWWVLSVASLRQEIRARRAEVKKRDGH